MLAQRQAGKVGKRNTMLEEYVLQMRKVGIQRPGHNRNFCGRNPLIDELPNFLGATVELIPFPGRVSKTGRKRRHAPL